MQVETRVVQAGQEAVRQAATALHSGSLVAFPTDTVYGLAAFPDDRSAVARIYEVKGRSTVNPISLLVADVDDLSQIAVLTETARPLIEAFWPGALTLVLPKKERVRREISPSNTVGVRLPDLPLARDLIRAAGGVLAVTSANRSGEPACLTAEQVLKQLGGQIELIVDGGESSGKIASTVLDCTVSSPVVLRQGTIPENAIRRVLERVPGRQGPARR
ncbi:MAG: threonylcarbamoyl-AMP synthase [Anaerolineae bacterium]|nr:threonylcarbamoyl-AMP synthase [Anaerolineae bacterium]